MGMKKMLVAGKEKSTMASQRLRHLDQVINDVTSGCVCIDGQDNPDGTSLVAGPVTTSADTCPVQRSNLIHNGGNAMALTECIVDAEVHAAENDRSLLNGSTMNTTGVSHQNGTNAELRQRPIFDEHDLSNALRSVFGSLSNVSGQSQVSVGMAPWNSDGPPMTSPRDAIPTGANIPASSPSATVTIGSVPSINGGPINLSVPQQNTVHRSSSMATVPVAHSVGNPGGSLQDVSAVMEQALKLQDTLLSQLERNKSVIQELQERSDSDASVLLSRNVPLEHDASLPQSSSEQQTVPQRVAPPTELSRDSGMGTINSVQSGPQQVTPQLTTDGQNDSQISVRSTAEPSDANRGRKRYKDITSKQERTKRQRRQRETSSSSSDSLMEEVRRKHHSDKRKSHQKKRCSRERSVLSSFQEDGVESDSDDSDEDDIESVDSNFKTGVKTPRASRFLPTFTGQGEKWEVWFARFEDVAMSHNWTKAEKLSALIPLLQRNAGEFVFGSVNKKVRTNYKKLVREL